MRNGVAAGTKGLVNEVKYCALDLQRVQEDGAFQGYASLFGKVDLGRDIVERGAFRESLARRGAKGIKMLFQHDPNQVIGVWDEIKEDARGLFVRGRLMRDVAKAREILALMREGALDGLSIGFRTAASRRHKRDGLRRISRIDLWEISVVTFPMLPEARVTRVKNRPFIDKLPSEREFERWLTRDAGLTRSEALALMRSGLKGLRSRREAGRGTGYEMRLAERLTSLAHLMRNNEQAIYSRKD